MRQRVRDRDGVAISEDHEAIELIAAPDRGRITGVLVIHRGSGSQMILDADLVVDATGRGSRAPCFLRRLGYGRPGEDEVPIHHTYASMPVRTDSRTMHQNWFIDLLRPGDTTGMVMFECEHNTWMLSACARNC